MKSIAQKAKKDLEWCYISGLVKALEGELVTDSQFQALVSAKNSQELWNFFSDTPYKNIFRHEIDLFDNDSLLNVELDKKLDMIKKYSPQAFVYEYFKVRGDIQHLKESLKSYVKGMPLERDLNTEGLKNKILLSLQSGDRELPGEYDEACSHILRKYAEKRDLQYIDFEADKQMLSILNTMSKVSGSSVIINYTHSFIDLKNLCALFRLKVMKKTGAMLSDILFPFPESKISPALSQTLYALSLEEWPELIDRCGYSGIFLRNELKDTSSLPEIEKRCDDFLMDMLRQVRYIPFGIEVIFAFLAAFFIEVLNMKIIIVGKLNQLADAVIRGKLRKVYV